MAAGVAALHDECVGCRGGLGEFYGCSCAAAYLDPYLGNVLVGFAVVLANRGCPGLVGVDAGLVGCEEPNDCRWEVFVFGPLGQFAHRELEFHECYEEADADGEVVEVCGCFLSVASSVVAVSGGLSGGQWDRRFFERFVDFSEPGIELHASWVHAH